MCYISFHYLTSEHRVFNWMLNRIFYLLSLIYYDRLVSEFFQVLYTCSNKMDIISLKINKQKIYILYCVLWRKNHVKNLFEESCSQWICFHLQCYLRGLSICSQLSHVGILDVLAFACFIFSSWNYLYLWWVGTLYQQYCLLYKELLHF